MKKRMTGVLIVIVVLLCTGCGSGQNESEYSEAIEVDRIQQSALPPEWWQTEYEDEPRLWDQETLHQLPDKQIIWGPGKQTDEEGRPTACVELQEKYKQYNAFFLLEDKPQVSLTFDEGYENGYTAVILDVLKEKGVSAVFFVTMDYVKREPDLVCRMIEEGHQVGNHTTHHPNMTKISLEKAREEVQELHEYVKQEFGYTMTLFRAPEGAISEQSMALLQNMGYKNILWSFAYKDWDPKNQPNPAEALQKITDSCHPGALYLLHAVSKTNAEILGDFIDGVRDRGYEFRPV